MDFLKPPSAYTPLSRWFGNERERELDEARALYQRIKARHDRFGQTHVSVGKAIYRQIPSIPEDVERPILHAILDLLEAEGHIFELPPPTFERMTLAEFVEYQNLLHRKERFLVNEDAVLTALVNGVSTIFGEVARRLPQTEDPSPFTIPLVYALPEPRLTIEQLISTLAQDELREHGLFLPVTQKLYENLCRVSKRKPEDDNRDRLTFPTASKLPLDELVDQYLNGTPFHQVFTARVPLRLTRNDRMGHMHVVGGTGAGKTTLLERLIRYDIASDDPPSIVVIDPHADLIQKLSKEKLGIEDRVIIIDPRDVQHPPALNVFAVNRERLAQYDEATREQVTAGVIQTFDYLFSGLFGADLTAKQGVFFRYVARLMLALPDTLGRNATILDMLRLMEEPPKGESYAVPPEYQEAVASLPDIPRNFFERDFSSKTFQQTKEQIRYRLQAIIENPTLARLFTAEDAKLDLFTEINRGSIILVDTAKDFLKGSSSHFGRIFVSLVLQAVMERAAIHPSKRKDTFFIIDEAASVFDTNIDDLLTEARKYRCGLVLAHQYLDQASHSLRASLAANTIIKFASGLSAGDARAMAPEMRTTADLILDQPRLQFAAHIRHVTPSAVSIPIEIIRDREYLDHETYEAMRERNREAVSLPPVPRRTRPQFETPPERGGNEDISEEW